MNSFAVEQSGSLNGELRLPGDKSITHRAIILSALSLGKTQINNPGYNLDCLHTISVFRKLGIRINHKKSGSLTIYGQGLNGLKKAKGAIYVGDSGTTLRLMSGVLAAQKFNSSLTAGKSLSKRPMRRVIEPLKLMGANISGRKISGTPEEYPPLKIKGSNLRGISYQLPVASAQVKSAIILAGLYAEGETKVIEPIKTRNHTEQMLKLFKAPINISANTITIKRTRELISPGEIYIPSDISSASFFIVAATILARSHLVVKSVSLNPTRTGFIRVLKRMGADITIYRPLTIDQGESQGDIIVKSSKLKGTIVKRQEIPSLIDELPILMIAACFAEGKTELRGVEELRVKETDRINSLVTNLRKMGAKIEIRTNDLGLKHKYLETVIINGAQTLRGSKVMSFGDHRTAMSMIIAGLGAEGETIIDDISCINKSFPGFIKTLKSLL